MYIQMRNINTNTNANKFQPPRKIGKKKRKRKKEKDGKLIEKRIEDLFSRGRGGNRGGGEVGNKRREIRGLRGYCEDWGGVGGGGG